MGTSARTEVIATIKCVGTLEELKIDRAWQQVEDWVGRIRVSARLQRPDKAEIFAFMKMHRRAVEFVAILSALTLVLRWRGEKAYSKGVELLKADLRGEGANYVAARNVLERMVQHTSLATKQDLQIFESHNPDPAQAKKLQDLIDRHEADLKGIDDAIRRLEDDRDRKRKELARVVRAYKDTMRGGAPQRSGEAKPSGAIQGRGHASA